MDILKRWHEGDAIAELDSWDILEAVNAAACHVEEELDEDGGPSMSENYYKVYTRDEPAFKIKLTTALLRLLKANAK